jgi:hypothetical protein
MTLFNSKYAFLDLNKTVINVIVFESETPDIAAVEAAKNLIKAVSYVKETDETGIAEINGSWNGTRFLTFKPFLTWIWSLEDNAWVPPIPRPEPTVEPYGTGQMKITHWDWSEESQSWEAIETIADHVVDEE